jgi:hypothetical protein
MGLYNSTRLWRFGRCRRLSRWDMIVWLQQEEEQEL